MTEIAGLTDTHVHLCDASFDGDRDEVLERARAAGVGTLLAVGETLTESRLNLQLQDRFPHMVRAAAGLFPTILDRDQADEVVALVRRQRSRLTAIGEVGLDFWKIQDREDRELQRQIFCRFIELSREVDLPLNVHSRAAGRQTIELLLERQAQRVQLHAFDGRAARALPAVEAGYFFSVPASVVRSPQKQKLVRRLPLSCLLLETDSPVLGADPRQRNEPANLPVALRAVAELKKIAVEEVAEAVIRNTSRLYGPSITTSRTTA